MGAPPPDEVPFQPRLTSGLWFLRSVGGRERWCRVHGDVSRGRPAALLPGAVCPESNEMLRPQTRRWVSGCAGELEKWSLFPSRTPVTRPDLPGPRLPVFAVYVVAMSVSGKVLAEEYCVRRFKRLVKADTQPPPRQEAEDGRFRSSATL